MIPGTDITYSQALHAILSSIPEEDHIEFITDPYTYSQAHSILGR